MIIMLRAAAAGLLVGVLITTVWKMSIHAAVGAGTVVILTMVFGSGGLLATPLALPGPSFPAATHRTHPTPLPDAHGKTERMQQDWQLQHATAAPWTVD